MIQVRTINVLIMWSYGWTEKSQNGQKQHITKGPKDKNQSGQKPPKGGNILIQQESRCTIPWSHNTGVDNQRSHHVIIWVDREKPKWTKAASYYNSSSVCVFVGVWVCSLSPPRSFDGSSPNLVGVCRWTSELPLRGFFRKGQRVDGSTGHFHFPLYYIGTSLTPHSCKRRLLLWCLCSRV